MILWTQDKLDVIAALLREGMSANKIAKTLGYSKGAVIGIVHRTPRLSDIGFPNPVPIVRMPDGTMRAAIRRRLVERHNGDIVIGLATVRKEKTLMELGSQQCRFPIWGHNDYPVEYLFCAEARTDDSSYCKAHRKLCLNQPHTRSTP